MPLRRRRDRGRNRRGSARALLALLLLLVGCSEQASEGVQRCTLAASCLDAGDASDAASGEEPEAGDTADAGQEVDRTISTEMLRDFDGVIIDVRSAADFEMGHIAGAVSLDERLLRAEVEGVSRQAPAPDVLSATMSAAGIAIDRPAVVYGALSDLAAARVV